MDGAVNCIKHTFRCLSDRFGCKITPVFVFSCEADPDRQRYIREAHKNDVQILFSSVQAFLDGKGHDVLTNSEKKVPTVSWLQLHLPACVHVCTYIHVYRSTWTLHLTPNQLSYPTLWNMTMVALSPCVCLDRVLSAQ